MDTNPEAEPLHVGTFVKLHYSDYKRVKIVEYRGPLGPGGMRIYRVLVRRKPKPSYIEVREDQIVVIPAPPPSDPKPKAP